MAKTWLIGTAPVNHTTNDTRYKFAGMGRPQIDATEANSQTVWSVAGTFSKGQANVWENGAAGGTTQTQTLRKNGADTAITFSLTGGQTGIFKDFTNTVAVSADDLINWSWANGSAADVRTDVTSIVFDATSDRYVRFGAAGSKTTSAASQSTLYSLTALGNAGSGVASSEFSIAGTFQEFSVYISGNARSTDTVYTLYKNGSPTAVTVTVPAGTTGLFTDSTHTETSADGDTFYVEQLTGTGTGNITWERLAIDHITTGDSWQFMAGCNNSVGVAAGNSIYFPIAGHSYNGQATIEAVELEVPFDMILSDLKVDINTFNGGASPDFSLYVNGVKSALSVTLTGVGWNEDQTHDVSVSAGDTVAIGSTNPAGSSGSQGIGGWTMVGTDDSAAGAVGRTVIGGARTVIGGARTVIGGARTVIGGARTIID